MNLNFEFQVSSFQSQISNKSRRECYVIKIDPFLIMRNIRDSNLKIENKTNFEYRIFEKIEFY